MQIYNRKNIIKKQVLDQDHHSQKRNNFNCECDHSSCKKQGFYVNIQYKNVEEKINENKISFIY